MEKGERERERLGREKGDNVYLGMSLTYILIGANEREKRDGCTQL